VAQLGRAPASGAGGRGFESRQPDFSIPFFDGGELERTPRFFEKYQSGVVGTLLCVVGVLIILFEK
jgi:hypothetical protein